MRFFLSICDFFFSLNPLELDTPSQNDPKLWLINKYKYHVHLQGFDLIEDT